MASGPEQDERGPSLPAAAASGAEESSQAAAAAAAGDGNGEDGEAVILSPPPPSAPTMALGPRKHEDDHLQGSLSRQGERDTSPPAAAAAAAAEAPTEAASAGGDGDGKDEGAQESSQAVISSPSAPFVFTATAHSDIKAASPAKIGLKGKQSSAVATGDGVRKDEAVAIPSPPPSSTPIMASGSRKDEDGDRKESLSEQAERPPAAASGAQASSQAAAAEKDVTGGEAAISSSTSGSGPPKAAGTSTGEDNHLEEQVLQQDTGLKRRSSAEGGPKSKKERTADEESDPEPVDAMAVMKEMIRMAVAKEKKSERQKVIPSKNPLILAKKSKRQKKSKRSIRRRKSRRRKKSKKPLARVRRVCRKLANIVKRKLSVYEDNIFTRSLPRSCLFEEQSEPHVSEETIPMVQAILYYGLSTEEREKLINLMSLHNNYEAFRPVLGDGQCFYRSFIFSYLEQVLDRQDTHEEDRLRATLRSVATQYKHLGWSHGFSGHYKAFKRLIRKVKRWKRSRILIKPSTESYRKKKLLKFFKGHRETAAKSGNLEEWCKEKVLPKFEYADHIHMRALASALGVPLRIVYLLSGPAQDIYTTEAPTSSMVSRSRPPLPASAQQAPLVTLLYANVHYDIIYRTDICLHDTRTHCTERKAGSTDTQALLS